MPKPMTAEALKQARLKLGLSQRKLGTLLGVPWNTIARWERGELRIERPELLRLAIDQLSEKQK